MSKELISNLRKCARQQDYHDQKEIIEEAVECIGQLEAENAILERKIEYLELLCCEEFAVSQAYKWQLQNTFEELLSKIHRGSLWLSIEEVDKLKFVLLDKSDTTALDAMIAKAGEIMREKCIPISFKQFLSDVHTAAGLLRYGKKDQGLADRLGKCVINYMTQTVPTITLNDLK